MAHHERCGIAPSFVYANATYDAIADLIREDERSRFLPPASPGVAAPSMPDTGFMKVQFYGGPMDRETLDMTPPLPHTVNVDPPASTPVLPGDPNPINEMPPMPVSYFRRRHTSGRYGYFTGEAAREIG